MTDNWIIKITENWTTIK